MGPAPAPALAAPPLPDVVVQPLLQPSPEPPPVSPKKRVIRDNEPVNTGGAASKLSKCPLT